MVLSYAAAAPFAADVLADAAADDNASFTNIPIFGDCAMRYRRPPSAARRAKYSAISSQTIGIPSMIGNSSRHAMQDRTPSRISSPSTNMSSSRLPPQRGHLMNSVSRSHIPNSAHAVQYLDWAEK